MWGFGRALAVEHPELWGGLIDLGSVDDDRDAARLVTEINAPDGEDQIALRGDRYVCRLAPCKAPAEGTVELHADGSYLITGGLGGLGIKIARWMAERGARHLVLVTRRGVPDRSLWSNLPVASEAYRVVTELQAIEQSGVAVEVVAADVTDRPVVRPCCASSARAGRNSGALFTQPPHGARGPWSKCRGKRSKACCDRKPSGPGISTS